VNIRPLKLIPNKPQSDKAKARFSLKRPAAWASFAASVCLGVFFGVIDESQLLANKSDTIYWSKNEFTIPFHIDNEGVQPSAVLLEMSSDNGLSWAPYARDSVKARQFRFNSQGDGLYLFRIKTIDSLGQAYDPGAEPLRVLVDTTSPEISLEIDTDTIGRLVANFQITERNPRIDGVRLDFQTEISGNWTSASFDTNRADNDQLVGQGILSVPNSARQLVVRLVVKDAAGNEAEVTRLPQLPRTASALSGMKLASGRNSPPSSPFDQNVTSTARLGNRLNAVEAEPIPSKFPAPVPTPIPVATPYPFQQTSLPTDPSSSPLLLGEPGLPSRSTASPSVPSSSQPGTNRSLDQKPYYSSSKAFSLDYSVDQQGPSQIASIELWGTADQGQTWEQWGTDPDGKSPFEISVEDEGLFGFRMVLVGANGLTSNRPRNGDNADAWILVDTQIPSARLVSALYGRGSEAGTLAIEFSARDDHFSDRPIKMSYSELPTGPWTTIVSGYENSGRYLWKAEPNLPRRVYLQMEAYDQAGNVGVHRLDLPVDIEGLAPRGKIQGFRAIPQ